jgi:hypothetical protein
MFSGYKNITLLHYLSREKQANRVVLVEAWIEGHKLPDTMDEGIERDNTSGGGGLPTLPGLYLAVQFSLRDEGSTEYMCVRGKITGDNIYRCQSACPVMLNDFDLFKENITSQSL